MKTILILVTIGLAVLPAEEASPLIDYAGFRKLTLDLAERRQQRRIGEREFLRMAAEPGTVILDTRSREKFEKLHVRGAVHLSFSDFTEEALAEVIPNKDTRVLIYCNNNFRGEPELLPAKRAEVALNVPTFINLHAYGYRNVYELKPLLDIETTAIPFAGSSVLKKSGE